MVSFKHHRRLTFPKEPSPMIPILTYLSSPMVLCCQKQAGSLCNFMRLSSFPYEVVRCRQ